MMFGSILIPKQSFTASTLSPFLEMHSFINFLLRMPVILSKRRETD
jgi:hypothetical protein